MISYEIRTICESYANYCEPKDEIEGIPRHLDWSLLEAVFYSCEPKTNDHFLWLFSKETGWWLLRRRIPLMFLNSYDQRNSIFLNSCVSQFSSPRFLNRIICVCGNEAGSAFRCHLVCARRRACRRWLEKSWGREEEGVVGGVRMRHCIRIPQEQELRGIN